MSSLDEWGEACLKNELSFYSFKGVCLVPLDTEPPEGARAVEQPFAPVAFLVSRDPLQNRFWFSVREVVEAFLEEGPAVLDSSRQSIELPFIQDARYTLLSILVREHGAAVVNTAFPLYKAVLGTAPIRKAKGLRANVAGLGDVGGALLTGLMLLGGDTFSEIGIYDKNSALVARYEQELNQILPLKENARVPRVVPIKEEVELFSGSVFLFCASRGVPNPEVCGDVRMAQWESNRALVLPYARMARKAAFTGLFAQISDPVDLLCRDVFLESNKDDNGRLDFMGLLPEQVRGYGLGVMAARARYAARVLSREADCLNLRVYGPHGNGLVAANDPCDAYDDTLSLEITKRTIEANLRVRETGFKPYIAPGISSACISVLRTFRGEWHEASTPLGGVYMGCRSRITQHGVELERAPLHEMLFKRIEASFNGIKNTEAPWSLRS